MHFLVHSAAPALAPLAPHLESDTQPLTVEESAAKVTPTNMNTTQRASKISNSFLITRPPSARLGREGKSTMPGNYSTTSAVVCNETSLAGRVDRWRLRNGTLRSDVNHLSGTRIMKLLAGFFFNPLGICFQLVDLFVVLRVFFLQAINIFLQVLVLGTFGAIDDHSICAEGHVHEQPDGEQGDSQCRKPSAEGMRFVYIGSGLVESFSRESFRLVGSVHQRTQPFLRRRQHADFRHPYSKIHCLAAALNFCNSCRLGASE